MTFRGYFDNQRFDISQENQNTVLVRNPFIFRSLLSFLFKSRESVGHSLRSPYAIVGAPG